MFNVNIYISKIRHLLLTSYISVSSKPIYIYIYSTCLKNMSSLLFMNHLTHRICRLFVSNFNM